MQENTGCIGHSVFIDFKKVVQVKQGYFSS